MNYLLHADRFKLSIGIRVFEEDISYPSNTIMDVFVQSDDFSGKASMEIDLKAFAKFAADLCSIYRTLTGTARITEPYGQQMHLSFTGNGRGQIHVRGMLCNTEHIFKFENMFDQTYLQEFAQDLITAEALQILSQQTE